MRKTMTCAFLILFFATAAHAKSETQAVSSPKCDEKKLKQMGGDAMLKVEKGNWQGEYNVTLDTAKMTFNQLLQQLAKEKCF